MLIQVDQLEKSRKRYDSWKDLDKVRTKIDTLDEKMLLGDLSMEIEPIIKGNIISDSENKLKRKRMIESLGMEPVDFAMERAIGRNDSVYSNFTISIGS